MPVIRLGLRANLPQFALLVAVNGLVGATVGQERTLLPLIAVDEFGVTAATAGLAFLVAFGAAKAVANLAAGALSDRYGRKPVLLAGWLIGLPVPLLIIAAPEWSWIVLANLLLGVNQGLCWSTTVAMKVDLVGPARRGLALGLNESAGYVSVAGAALVTGLIAAQTGLRPEPFLLGLAVVALGLGVSALFVRETSSHVAHEAATTTAHAHHAGAGLRRIVAAGTFRDPTLSAASQAGLVNNLNDGLAWGVFPLLFTRAGLTLGEVGLLVAIYPAVWGVTQIGTGALSDRVGRRRLIVGGMLLQAGALAGIALGADFAAWAMASVALGLGTALVYPTLIAVVADASHPSWRASAVGVYRFWRDSGYVVGAVIAGLVADRFGLAASVWVVAALTAASGLVAALRMRPAAVAAPDAGH
ncbi:MAG: major facilitator superfamily transporter [Chloroflexi bacterium CSP1-4]|nr:MAG: major facilitator superfamily transporter [Chloroflexi bacterium CSP1-4]